MEDKVKCLLEWSKGKKIGPVSVEIWPTNRCNLRCIMCGTWASRRRLETVGTVCNYDDEIKSELSDERLIGVVKESIDIGAKTFLITGGGEPFLRRDATMKIMEEVKANGLFGNMNTNGSLIAKEDTLKIVRMQWDMIMFSVDSHNSETHDYIRGVPGTFDKVIEVLMEFKRLKKEYGLGKPKVVFNTVVTNRNHDKLLEMLQFAHSVGCEDITFIPLIVYDESVKSLSMNEKQREEFYKLIPSAIKKSKELGISTNLEHIANQFVTDTAKMNDRILADIDSLPKGDFASLPCFQPFLHLLIKPSGEVTCCCMADSLKDSVKERSLKEVWYGEAFQKFRDKFLDKVVPDDCKTCVFSQFIENKELRNRLSELL